MFHFIFKTKLKRNVEIIWSIWLFKDNDSRTQLSCKDNLLARKPRQTNCMLIYGRLEDLVQLNNSIKSASPARKKTKRSRVLQVTLEQGA